MSASDPARRAVEATFPRLRDTTWRISSEQTSRYNCIAYAAGFDNRFWWPEPPGYWPRALGAASSTIDAFRELFVGLLGFEDATDDSLEPGYTKVALFARNGDPTHAARQLSNALWTSKLGADYDIGHALRALEGDQYGHVVAFFKQATSKFAQSRVPALVKLERPPR